MFVHTFNPSSKEIWPYCRGLPSLGPCINQKLFVFQPHCHRPFRGTIIARNLSRDRYFKQFILINFFFNSKKPPLKISQCPLPYERRTYDFVSFVSVGLNYLSPFRNSIKAIVKSKILSKKILAKYFKNFLKDDCVLITIRVW